MMGFLVVLIVIYVFFSEKLCSIFLPLGLSATFFKKISEYLVLKFSRFPGIFVSLKCDFASEIFQIENRKEMFWDTNTQRQKTPLLHFSVK